MPNHRQIALVVKDGYAAMDHWSVLLGLGCFGICQVGHMQSREVDVFRGARTRHSREHAHPTLEQPLGLLARAKTRERNRSWRA
jgi:hypothetical protein